MRIFLTGGTGFIGSHFVNLALAQSHEVMALRRKGSTPRIALDREPLWLEGQMTDPWDEVLSSCDAFVHLAAHGVNPSEADWERCFLHNLHESMALWLKAHQAGIRRFTVCGSCFEYGRAGERYEWIPTDAPLEPTGPYHASKAAASMAAIGLAIERKLELTLVRPFHVYGEGEEATRLWPALRRAALAGEDFPMTPGEQVRDFMPVGELVALLLRTVVEAPDPGMPRILNAGTGTPRTIRDFAEFWWQHWNASGKLLTKALPYRTGEVMRYVPRVTRAPKLIRRPPLLSIAIPTANRPERVGRLLRRLESEITGPEVDPDLIEICVFNNGGHPETAASVIAANARIPRFQTASSEELLPVGDSFANVIRLATGTYIWVLGDDDLPLRNSLPTLLRELADAEQKSVPMLQLQQHGCVEIDAAVEQMEAKCEPEIFSRGTDLLTPHAFHWLGQMSCTILHRRFFEPGSLFSARRNDEIIPLLRAVVEGLRTGSVVCLKGCLFARTVDAGNWQGMMAFAHAIEFPRYWNYLKEGRHGITRPFQEDFLARMIVRAAILRDEAPGLYQSMQKVPSVGVRHSLVRILVRLIQPPALRRLMISRVLSKNPGQAAALDRLREWNSRL